LVAVGLGALAEWNPEIIRMAAGKCARAVEREGFEVVAMELAEVERRLEKRRGVSSEQFISAWLEGWLLGGYSFEAYKQSRKNPSMKCLQLLNAPKSIAVLVEQAKARAEGVMLARDLCNEPANRMTPELLVDRVKAHFSGSAVSVQCYQGKQLVELGMNGLLAVGQGSSYKPAMIELTYNENKNAPLIVLIGKGITFDMGGMNIKQGKDLSEARYDMGGASAAIGAMHMLAKLKLNANVKALIPTSDNVPSASAIVPSSIIKYRNGITVQVGNTDAEGRLIIADALIYADSLGASEIIDIATLTGNVGQALGLRMAGVWGYAEGTKLLKELGERNGDRVWPMPLIDELLGQLDMEQDCWQII